MLIGYELAAFLDSLLGLASNSLKFINQAFLRVIGWTWHGGILFSHDSHWCFQCVVGEDDGRAEGLLIPVKWIFAVTEILVCALANRLD